MPEPKTALERLGGRKRRSAGSLRVCLLSLADALEHANAVLRDAAKDGDRQLVLRATHAIQQTAGAYARVSESHDLEARMTELEKTLASRS